MTTITPLSGPGHPLLRRLEVVFDPESRSLQRGGRRRLLAPREAELLIALLGSEPGEVVRRNDLLEAIWGDGEVCEDALTVIVSRLRRHFGRLGVDEPVIQTVPRRGYRLGGFEGPASRWREARREGRMNRTLGLAAVAVSVLALAVSCLALLLAMD